MYPSAVASILDSIPDSMVVANGLPQPAWPNILAWVNKTTPEERKHEIWCAISRAWIERLRDALGPKYRIEESGPFLVLAGEKIRDARGLASFTDSTFVKVQNLIPWTPPFPAYGHRVLIVLDDAKRYYSYKAHYHSEDGAYGASGGACFRSGYLHIVLNNPSAWRIEASIVHELVHLWLSCGRTPLWVEEGVAQYMPEFLLGYRDFRLDHELVDRHRAFWTPMTIIEFWTGDAFSRPDEGQELAYSLAQILIRRIIGDFPKRFRQFLAEVDIADAGDAAARQYLDLSISDLAAGFLGPGDWYLQPD